MVFSNEFTIGEVGLNEIRLVPLSESRHSEDHFTSAELARMRAGNRNSYAAPSINGSAGHSHRNGYSKSPYSSTTSLNSMESGQTRPAYQRQQSPMSNGGQPVAPVRKKRAAPRPPSQGVIPEDSATIRHKNFHVSSPNLTQHLQTTVSIENSSSTPRRENGGMRPVSMFPEEQSNFTSSTTDLGARRLSRTPSNVSSTSGISGGPDGAPRQVPRRKKAAPAPPPRSRESITPQPPVPTPRTITPVPAERLKEGELKMEASTATKYLIHFLFVSEPSENVSKTMLNYEEVPVEINRESHIEREVVLKQQQSHEVQKERLPASIAIVTSVQETHMPPECEIPKLPDPSQSDEDEENRMNIYNLNTRKCVEAEIVPESTTNVAAGKQNQQKSPEIISEAIQGMILDQIKVDSPAAVEEKLKPQVIEDLYAEIKKPPKKNVESVNNKDQRSDSPSWTYTLPAPPHFADGNNNNLLMMANGKEVAVGNIPNGRQVEEPTPTETTFNGNVYFNYTDDGESIAARSMTTTVVSDVLITPVIKERIPMLEQSLMLPLDDDQFNNNSESSDFNSSSTLTSASPNNLHGDGEEGRKKLIINSDIEDGYHGARQGESEEQPMDAMFVNRGLIATLEKRREKFIENELEQLVNGQEVSMVVLEDKDDHDEGIHDSLDRDEILLFDENKNKSTVIAAENEEPTISTSPVEDGLPRTRNIQSIQRPESANSENNISKDESITSGEESRNESLEVVSSPSNSVPHQSFEQRRSSFLAELENSKNLFNRRTSNELSISDAPSALQSIQVMRSIMMSTVKKDLEEVEELKMDAKEPVPVVVVENKEDTKVIVEKVVQKEVEKPAESPKPVVETKRWTPPKINLGSWSERPKIQVCLKTDSDYHHSLQTPSLDRIEQPNSMVTVEQKNEVILETLQLNNKEKLPIVRSMELKKSISVPAEKVSLSIQEPVEIPTPQKAIITEPIAKPKIQRPLSMYSTRMFTPTVRGFINGNSGREDDEEVRSTKINPVLMRSNSNVMAKANGAIQQKEPNGVAVSVKSPPPETLEKPIMFSQSTLRRTGLKDRILAKPEETTENKEKIPVEKPTIKLPLKSILVQRPVSVVDVPSSPISPPPPPPPPSAPVTLKPVKAPGSLLNPLAKLATAPVFTENGEKDKMVAQKPVVRGVVKKTVTPEVDPRTQLLDSIRNFSFQQLRKM